MKNTLLVLVIGALAYSVSFAQPTTRNVEREDNNAFKDWVSKDVPYIITDDERKAFEALKTNAERENFIATFWYIRDPNPDTEENEYREEHYERIAYANENFTSGKPGWRTDRGRIYIRFGKPDSIESRPMGGAYDRPSWEGGGSTTLYPFEVWFYRNIEGVGSGIEVEFVDPSGTGEYRIARSPQEKDALRFVPGAGPTTREALGLANRSDRLAGLNSRSYMREQDSPFRRLEVLAGLERAPKPRAGRINTVFEETPVVDNNPLEFDLRVDFFRQTQNSVVAAVTVQTDNDDIVFEDESNRSLARLNIFGRITSVSARQRFMFEDSVIAEMKDGVAPKNSIYQTSQILKPGLYKVEVAVRDLVSGNKGIRRIGFRVPNYESELLMTSSLVLTNKLRSTTENDIGARFVIGNTKVIPNLTGKYLVGEQVGLYLHVYNSKINELTLKPDVEVAYRLLKDGKVVRTQKEDWKGLSDSGQRLTIAKLISTAGLAAGKYSVEVFIKDRVGEKIRTLKPSAEFELVTSLKK